MILSPASSLSAASTAQTPAAGRRRMAEHTLNAEDMALNKLGDIEVSIKPVLSSLPSGATVLVAEMPKVCPV